MRAKAILCAVVVLTALLAVTAAGAATPAAYRGQVNALCRSYTPRMKQAEAQITAAQKANDAKAAAYAFGQLLGLALAEDVRIEAVPVPAALTSQIAPILRIMKSIDAHARISIAKFGAGDVNGGAAELTKIGQLAAPLNKMYDGAGLRDCGSNQS
ncbi:MAG TPA: hypothetical protein VMT59_01780 [Gaiellaceae bacterium]|nr:hypothetical protein [Gaiellaceae bacterium]